VSTFDDVDVDRLRRRRTVKWRLYGDEVLAAWVAEMDFDVAPVVQSAIAAAVDREDYGYVEPDLSELTTACAAFCAERFAWEVKPTRVFPVADVLRGIWAALDAYAPAGSEVVVPTPAYPPFFEVIELTGRTAIPVPLVTHDGRDSFDLEGIGAALAAGARTVLLCSPHNPTGRVFTADELGALAATVDRHGARVIADEVHAALTHPGVAHVPYASVSEAAAHHSVTVTSASKAFNLAGLKCAQLIATSHDDALRLRALKVFEVPGPTPIGIAASTAAYRDGAPWLDELVAYLAANRDHLLARLDPDLPGVSCRAPEATFLAWLDCRGLGVADPARFFLDEAKVALSDGPPFGPGCEQQVRLNLGTSRALLDRVLDAMATAARRAPGASPATTR
jgi:cystathionine beta-lyase